MKSSHIFSLPRVEEPPRTSKETLPTNNPLERGASLPNYLDLAVDSDPRRHTNMFRARTLVIPPTSGTVERPTPSRPAVVNLRSQNSGKQSLEAPRRSVDSLVQQYSPGGGLAVWRRTRGLEHRSSLFQNFLNSDLPSPRSKSLGNPSASGSPTTSRCICSSTAYNHGY